MKYSIQMMAFIIAALFLGSANAADLVVAISPYQSKAQLENKMKTLVKGIVALPENTNVVLLNGDSVKQIAEFTVPAGASYKSANARLKANRGFTAKIGKFIQSAQGTQSHQERMNLPEILRSSAKHYKENNKTLRILLVGSAYYDEPKEAVFSMTNGMIPSDAYILASRSQSPFGTKEQKGLLQGIEIAMAWPSDMALLHDQHRYWLERFWTLYIEQMNGTFLGTTQDADVFLNHPLKDIKKPEHHFKLDENAKMELIILSPHGGSNSRASNHEVEIGLRWNCACDLDLYAQANSNAKWLYFANTESEDGQHFKDLDTSRHMGNAYEIIRLHNISDISQVRLMVNAYSGDAPKGGITGELRAMIEGKTHHIKFTLPVISGNRGRGVLKTMQSGLAANHHILIYRLSDLLNNKG